MDDRDKRVNDFVLVEKVNLGLGRVDVDVNFGGIYLKTGCQLVRRLFMQSWVVKGDESRA